MKLQDTIALVTGANRGLGKALVEALVAAGAKKVYGGARNPRAVTTPGVVPVLLDVTKPDQIAAAARDLGDVTLVINNAGIYRNFSLVGDDDLAVVRETFETNVMGPLAVSRAFAPVLAANGGGAIANMLSVLSWVAFPGTSAYSASKAAALLFTDGLRAELAAQKTQVTAIHAAYIDTDMTPSPNVPKNDPAEVAQKIVAGLVAGDQEILIDAITVGAKASLNQPKPAFGR